MGTFIGKGRHRRPRGRRPGRRLVVLTIMALLASLQALPVPAAGPVTITSAGPLTEIILTEDLGCQVAHVDDVDYEFYPSSSINGACNTQVHVGGVTYGPVSIPAGNSPTPFTPVSISGVVGTGTAGDPYRVTTEVGVGATGLSIIQTDSYVVGLESYRSDVMVVNSSGSPVSIKLYRAGDCYLQNSDNGFGAYDPVTGAIACIASDDGGNTPGTRIEQWFPLTAGSHAFEAEYFTVWDAIANGDTFNDTCLCGSYLDNGAGLSWDLVVPAAGAVTVSHLTVFSPLGQEPLTMAKTASTGTVAPGGEVEYEITISNPNSSPVSLTVEDLLPAGFGYVAGSTTGATSADPAVTAGGIAWTGVPVPAASSATLRFRVTASVSAGIYYNEANATGEGVTVIGTGLTAPVEVVAEVNDPPVVGAGDDGPGVEGSPVALAGSASDTDPLTLLWSYVAGAGVDAGATCSFASSTSAVTTVTCTDDGMFTVTLTADDGVNPPVSDSAVVTIANANPTVTIGAPSDGAAYLVGATVNLSASLGDAGVNDTHTCSIDWGDGAVTAGVVAAGSCTGSHVYAGIGLPTVVVTVVDDDGGNGTDDIMLLISDVRTKVTGGGWLLGQDGVRVSLGLVADVDEGQLQLRVHNSDRFHGTDVEGLTATGGTATWSGPGRWNGVDGYRYEVTVDDTGNGRSKHGSPDTFSIVIRDSAGTVVFSISGPLGGGNLKVR